MKGVIFNVPEEFNVFHFDASVYEETISQRPLHFHNDDDLEAT